MDLLFDLGPNARPYCVLDAAVSGWSAAEPSLEVVGMAQRIPDSSGNNFAGVRSQVGFGYWRHLQSTRSRGPAKCLEADSDALIYSHVRLSSFPSCKVGACQRSRASAAEVVRLLYHARD